MHEIKMPPSAIDIALGRRGRLHVHENLDPVKTALIVVDLQNAFMDKEVAVAYIPIAAEIVPNVNRLAAAVRRTGGKVFWIKHTVDETSSIAWSEWLHMMTPSVRDGLVKNLAPGSRGHAIYSGLEVKAEDEVVHKHRFSAFVQGSSYLPQRLRAQGYDTVLITGTVTNVCCESSARDA
jgi:ureidoacrylate peracid hydrolase